MAWIRSKELGPVLADSVDLKRVAPLKECDCTHYMTVYNESFAIYVLLGV